MKATVDLIREWEIEHGESFFDQNEMINVSFLLGFILGKYGYEEFEPWFISSKDNEYLAGLIEYAYSSDYDEENYRKSLGIVCDLINQSEEHLKRFTDFLKENPI